MDAANPHHWTPSATNNNHLFKKSWANDDCNANNDRIRWNNSIRRQRDDRERVEELMDDIRVNRQNAVAGKSFGNSTSPRILRGGKTVRRDGWCAKLLRSFDVSKTDYWIACVFSNLCSIPNQERGYQHQQYSTAGVWMLNWRAWSL